MYKWNYWPGSDRLTQYVRRTKLRERRDDSRWWPPATATKIHPQPSKSTHMEPNRDPNEPKLKLHNHRLFTTVESPLSKLHNQNSLSTTFESPLSKLHNRNLRIESNWWFRVGRDVDRGGWAGFDLVGSIGWVN